MSVSASCKPSSATAAVAAKLASAATRKQKIQVCVTDRGRRHVGLCDVVAPSSRLEVGAKFEKASDGTQQAEYRAGETALLELSGSARSSHEKIRRSY